MELKIWGWDKKVRTMIRFIKPGDIFCFKLSDNEYFFGRIISHVNMGNVAEIFDYISLKPIISENELEKSKRLIDVVILDSYSLFDRKEGGEWRIIGHQDDYVPDNVENIFFLSGPPGGYVALDVFDKEVAIPAYEKFQCHLYTPNGDLVIKKLINEKLSSIQ
jgi:hypothetical protein